MLIGIYERDARDVGASSEKSAGKFDVCRGFFDGICFMGASKLLNCDKIDLYITFII